MKSDRFSKRLDWVFVIIIDSHETRPCYANLAFNLFLSTKILMIIRPTVDCSTAVSIRVEIQVSSMVIQVGVSDAPGGVININHLLLLKARLGLMTVGRVASGGIGCRRAGDVVVTRHLVYWPGKGGRGS